MEDMDDYHEGEYMHGDMMDEMDDYGDDGHHEDVRYVSHSNLLIS